MNGERNAQGDNRSASIAPTRAWHGRLMDHPLYPLVVHLPIGFWLSSLACDVIYLFDGNPAFASLSYHCILFGLAGAALAIPGGFAEYLGIPARNRAKRLASTQLALDLLATSLFLVNFLSRHGLEGGVPTIVTRGEIFLSTVSAVLLSISGYLGGILVYRYGIGIRPPAHVPTRAGKAA